MLKPVVKFGPGEGVRGTMMIVVNKSESKA
jgi:hypothetical protein